MGVYRRLPRPAVDQKHRLGVLHREKVLVPEVSLLPADARHRAGLDHLPGKPAGTAAGAGVKNVDGDGHDDSSLFRCGLRAVPVCIVAGFARLRKTAGEFRPMVNEL